MVGLSVSLRKQCVVKTLSKKISVGLVVVLSLLLLAVFFPSFVSATSPQTKGMRIGVASWYSTEACRWNPDPSCPTASGRSLYELEKEGVLYAAMWQVPFGTKFKVTNIVNNKSVYVVILDRGPAKKLRRLIDLSYSAFKQIADPKCGLAQVRIERI